MAFSSFRSQERLSNATLEKAARELNETNDTRGPKLIELRTRLEETENELLVNSRRDDAFLLRFLRARKFDLDRSYQLYVRYYEYRQSHLDIFNEQFTAEGVRQLLETGIISLGPQTVEVIESSETQINGIVIIDGHSGLSMRQAFSMSPSDAKGLVGLLRDCIPVRLKGIHVVHQPWFIRFVFAIIKPFLKTKMKDRIIFHGYDYTRLHQLIDPSQLPELYGGTLGEMDPKAWPQYLLEKERERETAEQTLSE